jgi:hypothetical protein
MVELILSTFLNYQIALFSVVTFVLQCMMGVLYTPTLTASKNV